MFPFLQTRVFTYDEKQDNKHLIAASLRRDCIPTHNFGTHVSASVPLPCTILCHYLKKRLVLAACANSLEQAINFRSLEL